MEPRERRMCLEIIGWRPPEVAQRMRVSPRQVLRIINGEIKAPVWFDDWLHSCAMLAEQFPHPPQESAADTD